MRYRKKPIVIEAVRIPFPSAPSWLADAMDAGNVRVYVDGAVAIDTPEGTMRGDRGDWIIQGVEDEIYPCKDSVFQATYEVEE